MTYTCFSHSHKNSQNFYGGKNLADFLLHKTNKEGKCNKKIIHFPQNLCIQDESYCSYPRDILTQKIMQPGLAIVFPSEEKSSSWTSPNLPSPPQSEKKQPRLSYSLCLAARRGGKNKTSFQEGGTR